MKNTIKGRRKTRELVVQFLFQTDFNPEPIEQASLDFWSDKKISNKEKKFADKLIEGVLDKKKELDNLLSEHAKNWDSDRLGSVDRTVMRIAVFEMLYCDEVPSVVAINEAVHFAKDLSSLQSGRFVNGVLDSVGKKLNNLKKNQKSS